MSGGEAIAVRFKDAMFQAILRMVGAVAADLVPVTASSFPARGDARLGPDPAGFPAYTVADLANGGFADEAPSGGRKRSHLLLSDFGVGSSELLPAHVFLLYMLRLSALMNLDFKIESVVGGASQTGPEAGTTGSPGNETLAQDRAASVASWLVFEMGRRASEVNTVSYGSKRPLIDKSADPANLEEPLNRNVIITYSVRIPPPKPPKPVVRKDPLPTSSCPAGSSAHWALNLMKELAVDFTMPFPPLPVIGVGGGGGLRIFDLQMLDDAANVLETRRFYALGGGKVADVDPSVFLKDIEKITKFVSDFVMVLKAMTPVVVASSTTIWTTNLTHMTPWLPVRRKCLTFENFSPQLMLTDTIATGSTGVGASVEQAVLPLLLRQSLGASYETGLIVVPSVAIKRQQWLLFRE